MPAAKKKQTSTKKRPVGRPAAKKKSSLPRSIQALIYGSAAIVCFLALLKLDGFVLSWVFSLIAALIGPSAWLLPVSLGLCSGFALTLNDGTYRMRVICVLLLPVLLAALLHPELVAGNTVFHSSLLGELIASGKLMHSGGLLGGLLEMTMTSAFSYVGSKLLLLFVTFSLILSAFRITPLALFRFLISYYKNHKKNMAKQENKPKPKPAQIPTPSVAVADMPKQGKAQNPADFLALLKQQEEAEREHMKKTASLSEQELQDPMADMITLMQQPKSKDIPPLSSKEQEELTQELDKSLQETPPYVYPPLPLLTPPSGGTKDSSSELRESSRRLLDTLASFHIDAQIVGIVRGPSVTRFEMQLPRGVKFSKLTALSDDIALALGAVSVRIAPIPDKIAVGIEVPNKAIQTVSIREVIGSSAFKNAKSRLTFALGKDITGAAIVGDIATMPHMLIAGTTGSGKSVCINSLLISLLYKATPEEVRLIMIDPKMIELGSYNGIGHLLIPVVTDPRKASGALNWAVGEMMKRYALFAERSVRDLASYNQAVLEKPCLSEDSMPMQALPQIVIVIDELADLMMVAAREVEDSICRIAQMARAAGMHLIIATQRPSADVITGIMKANIPSRIAFAVASQIESRIILDQTGAEKLIGKGDMLYAPLGTGKPMRIQGCFIQSQEVERVITHIKESFANPEYSQEILDHIEKQAKNSQDGGSVSSSAGCDDNEDALIMDAIDIAVSSGQLSVSLLQRKLKVGYSRAARLVDQIEDRGIVGPFEGSKPRTLLISREDWQEMRMRQIDG